MYRPAIRRRSRPRHSGQAILEYILMVVMLSVTIAVVVRNSTLNLYCLWTGLTRVIASPCAHCKSPPGPGVEQCLNLSTPP